MNILLNVNDYEFVAMSVVDACYLRPILSLSFFHWFPSLSGVKPSLCSKSNYDWHDIQNEILFSLPR